MAFSSTELNLIDATVGALVRSQRPPEHVRDQLDLELEVAGHKVRIFTVRPLWSDPSRTARNARGPVHLHADAGHLEALLGAARREVACLGPGREHGHTR